MIVIGNENNKDINNKFDEEAYKNAKYFNYNDYESAVNYVYKMIKYLYKDKIRLEKHYKFDCNFPIDNIEKMFNDKENLIYEDYYDIATFYDECEKYLCDLIINNGEFGLRYSIIDKNGNIENVHFESCSLNLENEITLMLDMKDKLEKFIYDDIEYSITMTDVDSKREI